LDTQYREITILLSSQRKKAAIVNNSTGFGSQNTIR
jgi:hypothetical protein